ncbi:unnamed protein product [Clavelina lepadiformis]
MGKASAFESYWKSLETYVEEKPSTLVDWLSTNRFKQCGLIANVQCYYFCNVLGEWRNHYRVRVFQRRYSDSEWTKKATEVIRQHLEKEESRMGMRSTKTG